MRWNFKILYTHILNVLCDCPWSHRQHLGSSLFHAIHSKTFVQSSMPANYKCILWVQFFWAWKTHIPCFSHNFIKRNSRVPHLEISVEMILLTSLLGLIQFFGRCWLQYVGVLPLAERCSLQNQHLIVAITIPCQGKHLM